MCFVLKRVVPYRRCVLRYRRDARLVELPEPAKGHGQFHRSFDGLLNMLLPTQLLVKDDPQDLGSNGWFNHFAGHDDLTLSLFASLPGEIYKLSFLSSKARPGTLTPDLNSGDVFGLYFCRILFCGSARSSPEVIINISRWKSTGRSTISELKDANRAGEGSHRCASPVFSSGTISISPSLSRNRQSRYWQGGRS